MSSAPWHPMLVHLPLGLSVVVPFLALALAILIGRGRLPRSVWSVVVVLQAIVLASGLASARTGEEDRRETVALVGSAHLDPHEDAGRAFNLSAGVSLALGAAGLVPGPGWMLQASRAGTVLATGVTAVLAYSAGRSGGELVYRYGAGSAYGK